MIISISNEKIQESERLLRNFGTNAFPRALSLAINRVIEGVRTDATNELKTLYYAKSSDIRSTITLKKSSAANLEAVMTSKGSRKNLSDYFISPKTPRKNMQGINAAVKRDGIKRIGNAFLIRRGGKYKPYVRTSSGKWGIEPIISPAIPQIMKNPEIVKAIEAKAAERFDKRLTHEVSRILGTL